MRTPRMGSGGRRWPPRNGARQRMAESRPAQKLLTVDHSTRMVDNRPDPDQPSGLQTEEDYVGFDVKPKFVTFDMNGTLIRFRINDAIREVLGDRLPAEIADDFLQACKAYRIDECMGDYKPFHQIVARLHGTRLAQGRPRVPRGRCAGGLRDRPHLGSLAGRHRGTEPPGRGSPAGHHHEQRHRAGCAPRGEPPGPVRGRHHRRADGRLQATARCVRVHVRQARRRRPTRSCTSPRARCTTCAPRPSWASRTRCTSTAASSTTSTGSATSGSPTSPTSPSSSACRVPDGDAPTALGRPTHAARMHGSPDSGMVDKRPGGGGDGLQVRVAGERTTTPEGVYRVLRAAILDGTVPSWWTAARGDIAADLGISRSPLREALTRLEEEGLIVKIPFRGAFVVEVSAQDVAEIASIRLLVEPYAAELALEALRGPERPTMMRTIEDFTGRQRTTTSRPASMPTFVPQALLRPLGTRHSARASGTVGRPSSASTSRSTTAPTATCTTSPSSTRGWRRSPWRVTRMCSGGSWRAISHRRCEPRPRTRRARRTDVPGAAAAASAAPGQRLAPARPRRSSAVRLWSTIDSR